MVQKRGEELVTKSFLKAELGTFGQRLKTEIVEEITSAKNEIFTIKDEIVGMKDEIVGIKDEIVGVKDEIVGMKDEIIKEIRELREEFDTHQFSHQRINDELQEHDERLRKLEPITSTG